MVSLQKIIPKVSAGTVTSFLTSKEVLIAGAVIIGVPLLLTQAQSLLAKIPFLRDHFTIAFLALGFMVFAIGFSMTGTVRIILMGLGAGFAVTGLAPRIQEQLSRLRNR